MSSKTLVSKTYLISHHKWGAGGKEQSEKTESKGLITIVSTPIALFPVQLYLLFQKIIFLFEK